MSVDRATIARRGFVAWLVCALVVGVGGGARAEEVAVPVGLQAELIAKVASYDKGFADRAGDRAQILVLVKAGDADSSRVAAHMQAALAAVPTIGGLPHDDIVATYAGGAALAQLVKQRRIAIVYVTPGFADDLGELRSALDGISVLSVSGVTEYVPKGVVLGFDLVSGKPKLVVNLTQAKRQHVAFKSEVLKIMKVYE